MSQHASLCRANQKPRKSCESGGYILGTDHRTRTVNTTFEANGTSVCVSKNLHQIRETVRSVYFKHRVSGSESPKSAWSVISSVCKIAKSCVCVKSHLGESCASQDRIFKNRRKVNNYYFIYYCSFTNIFKTIKRNINSVIDEH